MYTIFPSHVPLIGMFHPVPVTWHGRVSNLDQIPWHELCENGQQIFPQIWIHLNISSHRQNCQKVMVFFKTAVCVFVSGLPTWHFFVKLDRWHVIGAVPIGWRLMPCLPQEIADLIEGLWSPPACVLNKAFLLGPYFLGGMALVGFSWYASKGVGW